MHVFHPLDRVPDSHRGGAVAIGNFDGVHLGHRALIAAADAAGVDGPTGVLTFEPHPRTLFRPDEPPFRLTTLDTKLDMLSRTGAAFVAIADFNRDFADLSATAFIERVLVEALVAKHVVVGADFRFGRQRAGDIPQLEAAGRTFGFGVTALDQVGDEEGVFSSTRVRQLVAAGAVAEAAELLGQPWEIAATVEEGDKRGRTIGFPTANMRLGPLVEPRNGVYAVRVRIGGTDGPEIAGVANYGRRPTVNDRGALLEVHLFDTDRALYGETLWVSFIDFIRAEKKFDGLDQLKAQIAADCETARRVLSR